MPPLTNTKQLTKNTDLSRRTTAQLIVPNMVVAAFLICLLLGLSSSASSSLKYVQVLFRHGDRTPTHAYPTDPYQAWPEGWEQLTTEGMRQEYELGQHLRTRYVDTDFLMPNFTVGDVYVTSSYRDRCIMSANCMLAGLYPPSDQQLWNPAIAWQPVPVHAIPHGEDFMLKMSCPTYDVLYEEMMKSDFIKDVTAQYQDLIDLIGVHSGYKPTFENLIEMLDPIYVENAHNLTFPDWLMENDTYERFLALKDVKAQIKFHTKDMAKIKGGPILKHMIKNMEDVKNFNNITQKIDFYAAHDTTINAMLSSMDMFNGIVPMYAAAVFVELHHTQTDGWTVQIHYRNDTEVPPFQLTLPGCDPACSLSKLKQLTRDVIPDDPVVACLGPRPVPTGHDCISKGATLSDMSRHIGLLVLLATVIQCLP